MSYSRLNRIETRGWYNVQKHLGLLLQKMYAQLPLPPATEQISEQIRRLDREDPRAQKTKV